LRSEEGVCFTDSGLDDNRLKRQRRGHLGPDVPTQAELDIMREKAITYLHYLIIHREAIGFRRHPILEKMYRIPAKKKPLCEGDVREDNHS